MKNHLIANIPTFTNNDSYFPWPVNGNYDYWTPLLKHFLAKTDSIEIHCWDAEIETIEEIKSIQETKIDVRKEDNLTIFKASKTTSLSDYFLYESKNKDGQLKWFTLNLMSGLDSVFHSGHWGTEFFIPNSSNEDIEFIKTVTPKETTFVHY